MLAAGCWELFDRCCEGLSHGIQGCYLLARLSACRGNLCETANCQPFAWLTIGVGFGARALVNRYSFAQDSTMVSKCLINFFAPRGRARLLAELAARNGRSRTDVMREFIWTLR